MRGEQQVSWASRLDSPQRRSSQQTPRDSPTAGAHGGKEQETTFFSPSERRFDESPFPMSPESQAKVAATTPSPSSRPQPSTIQHAKDQDPNTAPAEMFQPHRRLSELTDGPQTLQQQSFDMHTLRPVAAVIAGGHRQISEPEGIQLNPDAPLRAIRNPSVAQQILRGDDSAAARHGKGKDVEHFAEDDPGATSVTGPDHFIPFSATERGPDEGPSWGESFRVEWIKTERLPFTRTRHLRNPWNHEREVKVSRDGTELEPGVGQALLDEWDKPEQAPQVAANVEVGRRLQGRASVSADVLSPVAAPSRKGDGG